MIKLCAFADEYNDNLDKQIEGLKLNNIDYIELRTVNGTNVADLTDKQAIDTYEKLSKSNIKVWSIGSPLGKVDIDCNFDEYKKVIERVCVIANIMHCDKVRMFSFFNAYDKKDKVFSYLQEMVNIGKKYNVLMCHENEKDVFGDSVDRVLEIQANVKGLKYVYDPANFVQCKQDSDYAIEKLFDSITYFHIKDVIASSEQLVPAGYGDGKIEKFLSKIDKNSDVVLTLEPHLAEFQAYKKIDTTVMKHKFNFNSHEEAFNFAAKSLKEILLKIGYKEKDNCFIK